MKPIVNPRSRRAPASPAILKAQAHFNTGLSLHQQGRMGEANTAYEKALELHPQHFDSLHLLGVMALQSGHSQRAVDFIEKAIAVEPGHAAAYNNLGNALDNLNQPEKAIASFDKAIARKKDFAEAYNNRGAAFRKLGQFQNALDSYDQAIRFKPDYAQAHYNRGNTLRSLHQPAAALESYKAALRFKPDYAEACNNGGNALRALEQFQSALDYFDKAVALKAGYADAHNNRGATLSSLGRFDEAVESFDRAIALKPEAAEAHYNRGNALSALTQRLAAIESYDRAIAHRADYPQAWCNRGIALNDLARYPESLASYDRAIDLAGGYADAYNNRGNTLGDLGQPDAAIDSYDKAIALEPTYASAHLNRALSLLRMGRFTSGWLAHEWRWKNDTQAAFVRNFPQPLWLGDFPLEGRTILLHAEQGLGDTLQFCRYAALVRDRGARVILEVQAPLHGLLPGLKGVAELVVNGHPLPDFDCHCPLLSLPLAFQTTLDSLPPAGGGYLRPPADKLATWAARLGARTGLRVGLVWSGSTWHKNDRNRSLALSGLVAHLPPGLQYICLQKEIRTEDRETLDRNPQIRHFAEEITDFTDTAALCGLVDVVISVDTSVAHLAGALGRPVWIALPFNPDWRWMLGSEDSPWYESVTLYRQQACGEWGPVFERIGADLARLAASGAG